MALDLDAARDDAAEQDEERVEIFTLNEKTYTVAKRPRVNIALKYLRNVRRMGFDYAVGELLEDMLGSDGYEALMEYDELTAQQFQTVIAICKSLAMGQVEKEAEKGGS